MNDLLIHLKQDLKNNKKLNVIMFFQIKTVWQILDKYYILFNDIIIYIATLILSFY